jgi:hypothetical protein
MQRVRERLIEIAERYERLADSMTKTDVPRPC